MDPKVDWFFAKATPWQEAFECLRAILLETGLTEELKWGHPCYTLNKKNVVLMHGFNDYCALLFHKGALLNDTSNILVQQTENVQSARQIRFTSARQITKMKGVLKTYIDQAIDVQRAGLKVELKPTTAFNMPEEFAQRLKKEPGLKKAFQALTPGRQRGYLLFFSSAKQAKTREARIDKHAKRILNGKGLDDE